MSYDILLYHIYMFIFYILLYYATGICKSYLLHILDSVNIQVFHLSRNEPSDKELQCSKRAHSCQGLCGSHVELLDSPTRSHASVSQRFLAHLRKNHQESAHLWKLKQIKLPNKQKLRPNKTALVRHGE